MWEDDDYFSVKDVREHLPRLFTKRAIIDTEWAVLEAVDYDLQEASRRCFFQNQKRSSALRYKSTTKRLIRYGHVTYLIAKLSGCRRVFLTLRLDLIGVLLMVRSFDHPLDKKPHDRLLKVCSCGFPVFDSVGVAFLAHVTHTVFKQNLSTMRTCRLSKLMIQSPEALSADGFLAAIQILIRRICAVQTLLTLFLWVLECHVLKLFVPRRRCIALHLLVAALSRIVTHTIPHDYLYATSQSSGPTPQ